MKKKIKTYSYSVSSKDVFDEKKNPKLSLSAKDIINNPKIRKRKL